MVLGAPQILPRSCHGFMGLRGALCIPYSSILLVGTIEGEENKYEMDGYWVCVSDLMNGWHWSWPGAVDVQHFRRQFIVPECVLPYVA